MTTLNYNLSLGNGVLLQGQALMRDVLFQVNYEGISALDVTIEPWISTDRKGPFMKIMGADKIIPQGTGSIYIALQGTGFGHLQFKVIATAGTAGKITSVDLIV